MFLATIPLVYSAREDAMKITVAIIYGCCSILLFTASTLYHFKKKEENERSVWRTIDHISIYIMIAGTYTPICAIVFRNAWGVSIISIQWGLALAGLISELFWRKRPRWISTILYLSMGWVAVTAIGPLIQNLSSGLLTLFGLAAITYSSGAIIYALKKPNPIPGILGHHEIFHILVLIANGFFLVIIYNVLNLK